MTQGQAKSACSHLTPEQISAILPHRPPFSFVDAVTALEPGQRIWATRLLRPEEPYFRGHFPGRPMMPGVLVSEALAQASGLLLALTEFGSAPPGAVFVPKMYFLAALQFKFVTPAFPGETLVLVCEREGTLGELHRFSGTARVGDRVVATGTLMLALAKDLKSGSVAAGPQ